MKQQKRISKSSNVAKLAIRPRKILSVDEERTPYTLFWLMILSLIFDLKLYKIMKGKMFRIFGSAVNGRIEAGNWLVGHSTSGQ